MKSLLKSLFLADFLCLSVSLETPLFTVSSITYSPGLAESVSSVSLTFASGADISSINGGSHVILLTFPETFNPVGVSPTAEVCSARFGQFGLETVLACESRFSAAYDTILRIDYSWTSDNTTILSPLLAYVRNPASGLRGSVVMEITSSLGADTPMKVKFCCMHLPAELEGDSSQVLISLQEKTTAGIFQPAISAAPVKFSPRILLLNGWNQLRLSFSPALPNSESVLTFTIEPGIDIPDNSQLILSLPGLELTGSVDASEVEFAVTFQQGIPVNMFNYFAEWDTANYQLIFRFASAMDHGTVVEISTLEGGFSLPGSSVQNNADYKARVSLPDGSDLIGTTSFFQSDAILPEIQILFSQLDLVSGSCCILSFSLNRGISIGSLILLSLPGYSSQDASVLISSPASGFVQGTFDSATSLLTLTLTAPLAFDGSGQDLQSIVFSHILLPIGQYLNDPSVSISVGSSSSSWFPVMRTQKVGVDKSFSVSSLEYDPIVPTHPPI